MDRFSKEEKEYSTSFFPKESPNIQNLKKKICLQGDMDISALAPSREKMWQVIAMEKLISSLKNSENCMWLNFSLRFSKWKHVVRQFAH